MSMVVTFRTVSQYFDQFQFQDTKHWSSNKPIGRVTFSAGGGRGLTLENRCGRRRRKRKKRGVTWPGASAIDKLSQELIVVHSQ